MPQSSAHPIVLHAAHLLEVDSGRLHAGRDSGRGRSHHGGGHFCAASGGSRDSSISAMPRCCRVSSMRTCICFCTRAQRICRLSKNPCRSAPSQATLAARADLHGRLHRGARHGHRRRRIRRHRGARRHRQGPDPRAAAAHLAATRSTFSAATRMPTASIPRSTCLSNATYANTADELVAAIREQHKEGADFVKIYETGPDKHARRRTAHAVPVHAGAALGGCGGGRAPGRPRRRARHGRARDALCGAGRRRLHRSCHAAERRDHADHEGEAHSCGADIHGLRVLRQPPSADAAARWRPACSSTRSRNSRSRLRPAFQFAVGSDVGPFPHGTQAREFELMVKYGMKPARRAAGRS